MTDDFLTYYNDELAYLRDLGAEFARQHPKVAQRLQLDAGRCEDPHVERLLEGFAFLAARVRKKLDDDFPEITDAFLNVLYPHYLRPVPSTTIVQLTPGPDVPKAAGGQVIPAGAKLITRPVEGEPCRFRTTYPVTLLPVSVTTAQLDSERLALAGKPASATALLKITLTCSTPARWGAIAPSRLRFHLDGTGPAPYTLYETMLTRVCRVEIRRAGDASRSLILPAHALQPVGFGLDEGLFPYPANVFPGYRLLQEYFACPEKFLFVDLCGLDRLAGTEWGESIEVLLYLESAPRGLSTITADHLRLHCTPAVNLFSTLAEPITLSHERPEYRVVPDVRRPDACEVYAIDRVTSAGTFLEDSATYEPFYALKHSERGDRGVPYWFATRRPSLRAGDRGTEVFLTFVDRDFHPSRPASRTVSVQTTCTNRDLPALLPFGGDASDFELETTAAVSRVRCLRKPTRSLRPPLGRGDQWRLISHLSLNHLSLAEGEAGVESLRELLRLYDLAESAVTRQQIDGLVGVASRPVAGRTGRGMGNAVCLGCEVELTFDETCFAGSGAFLMASVLERFLGLYVSINSFVRLVARSTQREGVLKRWPPRSGDKTLL